MLKRIVCVALLAACTSRDDVTQIAATNPPVDARGNGFFGAVTPAAGPVAVVDTRAAMPSFVWANPATAAGGAVNLDRADIEQVAREILAGHAASFRYTPRQVAELELGDLHDTGRGPVIARFRRSIEGVEVFGEQIAVAMDRALAPLALSGGVSFVPLAVVTKAKPGRLSARFTLGPEQALIAAIADLTGVVLEGADLDGVSAAPGGYQNIGFGAPALGKLGALALDPARTKPVLFPAAGKQLETAYYVEANVGGDAEGAPRYFAYVVSADDGSVFWKRDLTSYDAYRYRVYADDTGLFTPWDGPQGTATTPHASDAPREFDVPFMAANLVTVSSLEAVGVTDPWLPSGASETRGNNADAYLDIVPPDGFTAGRDFRGLVSAAGVFDMPFDPVQDANIDRAQQTAAVTQLFYDVNWFHDWYYAAGFTEAAGNAQASNFGRGGLGGDAIRAEAQDVGGANNANMSTPADGAPPRMQMYLWDYGPSSLTVTEPASLAGTFTTGAAAFAPKRFDLSGRIVRADPVDGCAPLQGNYVGAIVLIDRGGDACGTNAIAAKARNAQLAGAVGAVVANVATSPTPEKPPNSGGTPSIPIRIGVLSLNLEDGNRLRAALGAGEELSGSLFRDSTLRDGDIDNQIVAHEWGHYISNRLVLNSAGLGTNMAGGLGEGWGDIHAMLITLRPEDVNEPTNANWDGAYSLGGYATAAFSRDPYYFGTRRYPYSTDMTKDPLTFKHISDEGELPADVPRSFDGDHAEVHNVGEVWASMLFECYVSLLRDTVGPAPRLSFAEARDRMRDYIVAGYKLTPANPTLLEARDALLAAALATDRVDLARFSAAFAKRGAGVFAVAPSRFDATNSGVVESYESGAALVATAATLTDDEQPVCVADGILDDGETGSLRVTFKNVGNAPSEAAKATVTTEAAGVRFPMGVTIDVPPLPIFGTAEGSVPVGLEGLSDITPIAFTIQLADARAGVPAPSVYAFATNADQLPNQSLTDAAESSHVVWAIRASSSEVPGSALWQRMAVSTVDHFYHCASSPVAATVDLQSPPLEVLPGQAFRLAFRHRHSFEAAGGTYYDGGVIELSSDGGASWNDVGAGGGYNGRLFAASENPVGNRDAFVAESIGYPAFVPVSLNLGTGFGGQTVLVRFRVGSDAGTASSGWDIDDIGVSGVATAPFDTVVPQSERCSDAPARLPNAPFVAP